MRRFSIMQNIPIIIVPSEDYEYWREIYPETEEMTDGKLTGFFNALGYFIGRY